MASAIIAVITTITELNVSATMLIPKGAGQFPAWVTSMPLLRTLVINVYTYRKHQEGSDQVDDFLNSPVSPETQRQET
jgi:hypothetical protein